MILYIKDKERKKVVGADFDVQLNIKNIADGLYLYYKKENNLRKIPCIYKQGRVLIEKEEDFREIFRITGKIINNNGRYWELIELKYPVKKGIFDGTPVQDLAYEVIEFEVSEREANKYKGNLLSYEQIGTREIETERGLEIEKYGIAKAYRYKFCFCYLSDSLKIDEQIKKNYTKDLDTYLSFNQNCRIIALKDEQGRITSRLFYEK